MDMKQKHEAIIHQFDDLTYSIILRVFKFDSIRQEWYWVVKLRGLAATKERAEKIRCFFLAQYEETKRHNHDMAVDCVYNDGAK